MQPTDRLGNHIQVGDTVRLLSLPDGFCENLPSEEAVYLKNLVGELTIVSALISTQYIELEAKSHPGEIHFISIDPSRVLKTGDGLIPKNV